MIEVTAAADGGICYNVGGDFCFFVVVAMILVVFASIGVMVAGFAKNNGPGIFFLL